MPSIPFTEEQRAAIAATDAGVMVSAAAGSGKTAVLAERCAYFVCDAPLPQRCNADELLVLTFTDAAAAEMRSRIIEAIRSRLADRPTDDRLREQLALMDAAKVTTVHSFCLWLIRRWFSELGIDPLATLLDQDENRLLKSELVDTLFSGLYAATSAPDDVFGLDSSQPPPDLNELGPAFAKLVSDYGLGKDRNIAEFVLSLYEFTMSLPDPDQWLSDAYEAVSGSAKQTVAKLAGRLKIELGLQIEHCEKLALSFEGDERIPGFYAERVRLYVDQLRGWESDALAEPVGDAVDDCLSKFEIVRSCIAGVELGRATGPRLPKDADADEKAFRDSLRDALADMKKRLFRERLKNPFALFSVEELLADLAKTAPFVRTTIQLVKAFRDAYSNRKRELGVLDFSDLERFAFDLLSKDGDAAVPSAVAVTLHERFRYVLVDEFQDINPIQHAIIRLASREADPDRPSNLFIVGDVKQSIYRFRLAEPGLFIKRLRDGLDAKTSSIAIHLQSNFRSRSPVLDAVNTVFERLMREDFGGVAYDEHARLRAGRAIDADDADPRVELHVLERNWSASGDDEDDAPDRGPAASSHPSRWAPIEREAYLIGSRINEWMGTDGLQIDGRPLAYRDVAVLLRSRKINAEKTAMMLAAMGIPAFADASGSLLAAREVRDVLAALELFDNAQQDIPLAAVLRSGILGDPLSVDELIDIRCHDRAVPFHEAVRGYAKAGSDESLRSRLHATMDRLADYRRSAQRRPLADVLWTLYEKQSYLAYASGLSGGAQCRANLLELHDLARRFGTFRRQGLHRFLAFLNRLEDDKQDVSTAPAVGEADDVVRIMTIHQSKGLEFPVVFVAGLGTKFNLKDKSGRMIFERRAGIGLRAVDTERMIEYPTTVHAGVAGEISRSTREEEMRVLYVAMTRARDKLVLIGSRNGAQASLTSDGRIGDTSGGPSRLTLTAAMTPLDWLTPIASQSASTGVAGPFEINAHSVEEMSAWRVTRTDDASDDQLRRAAAELAELPPDEPTASDDSEIEVVRSRIDYVYPFLASSSVRAVVAASAFKGSHDFLSNPETRSQEPRADDFSLGSTRYGKTNRVEAAQRGVVTHRVLQHLDFMLAVDGDSLASELHRLIGVGVLTDEECAGTDIDSIEWFLSTPEAEAIRAAGRAYRREFMYLATEPLSRVDGSVDAPPEDVVLVRGVVDGVIVRADSVEILDFKTDAIGSADVAARAERYRPQVEYYARAMARIWRRPVKACRLVFLGAKEIASVDTATSDFSA